MLTGPEGRALPAEITAPVKAWRPEAWCFYNGREVLRKKSTEVGSSQIVTALQGQDKEHRVSPNFKTCTTRDIENKLMLTKGEREGRDKLGVWH